MRGSVGTAGISKRSCIQLPWYHGGFLLISHFRDIKTGHPVGQIVGRLAGNIWDEIVVIFLVIIRRIIGDMIQSLVDGGCSP